MTSWQAFGDISVDDGLYVGLCVLYSPVLVQATSFETLSVSMVRRTGTYVEI